MPTHRVNEIDLLRFLSAMAVVLFHYAFRGYAGDGLSVMPAPALAPLAKYGYLGVMLFFMISGFAILLSVRDGSLRNFVVSRIVRLYPAFWTCCTITFLCTLWFGAPRFAASLSQYLVNMSMMNEFVDIASLDGAYWSLAVEMRFYFLVAIVLLACRLQRLETLLAGWLLVSCLLLRYPVSWTLSAVLLSNWSGFFIGGALCYLIFEHGCTAMRAALLCCAWGLSSLQVLGPVDGFELTYHTEMSRTAILATVAGFFGVFALIALRATGRLAAMRWSLAGAITYPVYLLHQNIGYMVFNRFYPEVDADVLMAATLAGMLGLAALVHRVVERRAAGAMKVMLNRALDRAAASVAPRATP